VIAGWWSNGVRVIGTTLNRGSEETGDFWTHKLVELGVEVHRVDRMGMCAAPGCSCYSYRTARTSAVGSNWVGGAESYQPYCTPHYYEYDVL
jgi:thymidine kinase